MAAILAEWLKFLLTIYEEFTVRAMVAVLNFI
jgi:hypothetical protein